MTSTAQLTQTNQTDLVPEPSPLVMPIRPVDMPDAPHLPPTPEEKRRRSAVLTLSAVVVGLLTLMMTEGLARDGFRLVEGVVLVLYVLGVSWIAFSAATALYGAVWQGHLNTGPARWRHWRPRGRTGILIPARNEDIQGLGRRIEALRADLTQAGCASELDIFILSDSTDARTIAAEERLANKLGFDHKRPRVYYRRRHTNEGRKVGNISQWVRTWGGAYDYMLMLDADSTMSARRILNLVHRMEIRPDVGLIQTGIRLIGATSRFSRLQQTASKLYGGAIANGIAGWAGETGNYWGHNALIRVRAFADAGGLPSLSGPAPRGGDILSHDFIEAAWLARAGWGVEIDPDSRGSAEGGPESIAEFHKRDRRWCQGNLQHARILFAEGLATGSRMHLACGIAGYVAAPLWLALVVATIATGPSGALMWPVIAAMSLLLVQKAAGVAIWLRRRPGSAWAREIVLRRSLVETLTSTVLAPILMLRQTVAVVSVLAGQDCGWKPQNRAGRAGSGDMVWLEPAVGAALLLAVLPGVTEWSQIWLAMPIVAPLLLAPLLVQWFDLAPGESPAWVGRALDAIGLPVEAETSSPSASAVRITTKRN